MTIDPFAAERRDGRIYGRGATDTKGTIAAMLCALAGTCAPTCRNSRTRSGSPA